MTFENINLPQVAVAGVAAWVLGYIYYSILSKPWADAMGLSEADKAACRNRPDAWVPFVLALVGSTVCAYVFAALLHYVAPGGATVHGALISAFFVWLGFVLPPFAVNNAFSNRDSRLTLIDSGYWLLALLLQGALLGAFAEGKIHLPF